MILQTKKRIGDLDCYTVQRDEKVEATVVVILCHGFGAPPTDLVSLGEALISINENMANIVCIFPGAPLELDPDYDARAWWMIDIERIQRLMESGEFREMRSTSPERLPECRESIFKVIEHAKQAYSLPSEKIVVGGFSQGAMLSTDVALHYPESLGGLIVWSGALINEPDWESAAKNKSPIKIAQTHGSMDQILPIEGAEALRDMLIAAGHDVNYQQFAGPHTIPQEGIEAAVQLIGDVGSDG